MLTGGVITLAMQYDPAPEFGDRLDLDLGRVLAHDNVGLDAQPRCRKCNTLCMIARGSGDYAATLRCGAQLLHLVVGAPQLETKDRLQVFPLQPDPAVDPVREPGRGLERRLHGNVVDTRLKNLFNVLADHEFTATERARTV